MANDESTSAASPTPAAPPSSNSPPLPPPTPDEVALAQAKAKAETLSSVASDLNTAADVAAASLESASEAAASMEALKASKEQALADLVASRNARLEAKGSEAAATETAVKVEALRAELAAARDAAARIPELEAELESLTSELDTSVAPRAVLSEENVRAHNESAAEPPAEVSPEEERPVSEPTVDTLSIASSPVDERFDVRRVFDAFDADSSGAIDAAELKDALIAVSEKPIGDETVAEVLKKFDVNGDGVISLQEFQKMTADPMFKSHRKRCASERSEASE